MASTHASLLAGRDIEAILHAFPELAPAAPRAAGRHYYRRGDIEQNRAARRETYAAIRRDFDARNVRAGTAAEWATCAMAATAVSATRCGPPHTYAIWYTSSSLNDVTASTLPSSGIPGNSPAYQFNFRNPPSADHRGTGLPRHPRPERGQHRLGTCSHG